MLQVNLGSERLCELWALWENEIHSGAEWKNQCSGGQEAGREREIIKTRRGDKVSKSNLAICDPISTATLCVCSEHFVSFGIHWLFSPMLAPVELPPWKDKQRDRKERDGGKEIKCGERERMKRKWGKIKSEWGIGRWWSEGRLRKGVVGHSWASCGLEGEFVLHVWQIKQDAGYFSSLFQAKVLWQSEVE